jgi:hypothetical protein
MTSLQAAARTTELRMRMYLATSSNCCIHVACCCLQNQIRSEEEFQAKKAKLREQTRERLDAIFEQKGKHLIVDSDDDDFSIK